MKIRYILFTVGLITTPLITFAAEETVAQPQEQPAALSSQQDKLSYSFGQNIGNSLKQQKIELNLDLLMKGIQDAIADKKSLLTPEEMANVLKEFQKERFAKLAEERKALAETNLKEGETFLTANKAKEGVITLPSGLQYKVITQGTGKTPKATDQVTTHYRGTLIDGTEFDSSYKRGKPASFAVNQVIPGWTEALQLMKEGDKWQLVVPAKLGYGDRGVPGGKIGPNATLIFDIELISVNPVEEDKASAKEGADSQSTTDKESNSQKESTSQAQPKGTPSPAEEKNSTPAEDKTKESSSQQQSSPEETSAEKSQPEPSAAQPSK
ncbi:FKBP-type peptidylprolyl cis-trans isomerase [Thioploca ingrica]|uniref:peptidylprolyl isomerase n=1 Tax=Thioploca ingrica TaxID=40754 RepID=A0A090BVH8_9GAMM|nr:FKBP-type peptidylprolyl cis-trans isomerase [Thioploca ingrica]